MYRHPWNRQEDARRRAAAEAGRQRAAAERPVRPLINSSRSISDVPTNGLGQLAILPNEIIIVVFDNCTLRSLLRLERVNKAAKDFVNLLHDIEHVRETAKGIVQRAKPHYRKFMLTILKITTYRGLRYLLTNFTCETCGQPGSFRMVKVKVLCDTCQSSRRLNSN
ncbi:uncharacterized protein F4822DRAFT_422993 [Hypoxylon trugodes]|uniref:uncharacterized protein n=1 Tax=Hypoxylon trugodes TaxID=326681 RepID=UPI002193566E|nr:uncharacterized protein F4822DRAFT_422993 [Hypoxylon trugodes]KAI1382893.1 hypothetical protein F4822DRAFT_422993 [Hypoxylon trugodes]